MPILRIFVVFIVFFVPSPALSAEKTTELGKAIINFWNIEEITELERTLINFGIIFEESYTKKSYYLKKDSCTEIEWDNNSVYCQDNYSFVTNDGVRKNLHDYQKDQLKYALVESNLKNLKETSAGKALDEWYQSDIAPWLRAKIMGQKDGKVEVVLPGRVEDNKPFWEISFSPSVEELDSFGYAVGLDVSAFIGDGFTIKMSYLNYDNTFELKLDYKATNNLYLNLNIENSDAGQLYWVYLSLKF